MEIHSSFHKSYWKTQLFSAVFYGFFIVMSLFVFLAYDYTSIYYYAGISVCIMTIFHVKGLLKTTLINLHIMENKIVVTNFIYKNSYIIYYDQILQIHSLKEQEGDTFKQTTLKLKNNKSLTFNSHQFSNYHALKDAILTNRKPADME